MYYLLSLSLVPSPKNLQVETLPDPIGHFGAPCRPFWILKESWSSLSEFSIQSKSSPELIVLNKSISSLEDVYS